jgi:hypothetical protein
MDNPHNPFADMNQPTINPFTNAKVVSENTDPAKYFVQPHKRGEASYIVSRSDLVAFGQCPRRWLLGFEPEDSDAMVWGSLLDCLLLSPDRFAAEYVVKPSTYTDKDGTEKKWNGNATKCKEWAAEHEGKKLVGADVWDSAQLAIERLQADARIHDMLTASKKQVMVTGDFTDAATGVTVPVRCMIDLVPPEPIWLADLKTVRTADAFAWKWEVFRRQYHVQAAMYLDLWNAATGDDRSMFAYVMSENLHPYEPARRCIGPDFIGMGRGWYCSKLQDYCHAIKTGVFRGYEFDCENEQDGFGIIEPDAKMVLQGA